MAQMNNADVVAAQIEKLRTKIPMLFERDETFYSTIRKVEKHDVSSKKMRIPLHISSGGNFGHYDPDGGGLGRGSGLKIVEAMLPVVHLRHAVEWTELSEIATNKKSKSVINAFRKNLADGMKEFRRYVDSLCMTEGNGVLGTIGSVSGTTYTMSSDGFDVRLLRKGQKVSVYNSALTTRRGSATINSIDSENKTVTVGTAVTGNAATDKLVVDGLTATPPASLLGVLHHHSNSSTGNWLELSRATYPEIRANRVNAGDSSFSLPYARLAINKIGERLGMKKREKSVMAWMHPAQAQAYEELGQLVSFIQKTKKDEGLNLYFGESKQLAGAMVKEHYSWNKKRIDFVVKEAWLRAEMRPPGFYGGQHGKKIFEVRSTDGGVATAWVYYLTASFNLGVDNPPCISYVDNLEIPEGY